MVSLVLLALLAACGDAGPGDPQGVSSPTFGLPAPRQLPAPPGAEPLDAQQVARLITAATADRHVTAALREGAVSDVTVRAGEPDTVGTSTGVVAFWFRAPVTPTAVPWDILCDIGGQTEEWRGVAARVESSGQVESSPIWSTGANCVGWQEPA